MRSVALGKLLFWGCGLQKVGKKKGWWKDVLSATRRRVEREEPTRGWAEVAVQSLKWVGRLTPAVHAPPRARHVSLPPKKFESVTLTSCSALPHAALLTERADNEPMAQLPDYYAVLGVDPTATPAEITRAWRRLVLLVRLKLAGPRGTLHAP